jgi:hypothetical protein
MSNDSPEEVFINHLIAVQPFRAWNGEFDYAEFPKNRQSIWEAAHVLFFGQSELLRSLHDQVSESGNQIFQDAFHDGYVAALLGHFNPQSTIFVINTASICVKSLLDSSHEVLEIKGPSSSSLLLQKDSVEEVRELTKDPLWYMVGVKDVADVIVNFFCSHQITRKQLEIINANLDAYEDILPGIKDAVHRGVAQAAGKLRGGPATPELHAGDQRARAPINRPPKRVDPARYHAGMALVA